MEAWASPPVPRLPGPSYDLAVRDAATGGRVVLPPHVSVYVCGITPYDATHLGHASTYLAFDTLVRAARDSGRDVTYVQNVTDVDDPLFERAQRDGVDWVDLGREQIALFRSDMTALRVLAPDSYVGAVESIPMIVEFVERLVAAGATYRLGDDLYFSATAGGHLGEVSHLPAAQMLTTSAERGGDPGRAGKKDPLDPLVWVGQRPGEPGWPSPWGAGRPGWHVECTAIALDRLGSSITVQGGGGDLVFPHHEFGAAHAVAATGVWPFAEVFMHTGMLRLAGAKMSKSLGNLVFVHQLVAGGADPGAVRLALLDEQYRDSWEWTPAHLDRATGRLAAWRSALARRRGPSGAALLEGVRGHLADDLDTPAALRAIDAWAAHDGPDEAAPSLVSDLLDALFGLAPGPVGSPPAAAGR